MRQKKIVMRCAWSHGDTLFFCLIYLPQLSLSIQYPSVQNIDKVLNEYDALKTEIHSIYEHKGKAAIFC